MLPILDIIGDLGSGEYPARKLNEIDTIAVHRVGLDLKLGKNLGNTAPEIAKHFAPGGAAAPWTGGKFPYHFVISKFGQLWQCIPLSRIGPHAKSWNRRAIGVAFIGDFRVEILTPQASDAGRLLLHRLLGTIGLGSHRVFGHDELPDSSSDPNKECPGLHFGIDRLRQDLAFGLVL